MKNVNTHKIDMREKKTKKNTKNTGKQITLNFDINCLAGLPIAIICLL